MKPIAILGAGRMGRPMAAAIAARGYPVELIDLMGWKRGLPKAPTLPPNVTVRQGFGPYLSGVQALFEALPEQLEIKAKAYRALGPWLPAGCPVGSTTSSLTAATLSQFFAHPERLLLTHWLYPPGEMALVEVAPSAQTDPELTAQMLRLLKNLGKEPIVVADSPGLVIVRLQTLLMNEAARLTEQLEPAVIDAVVRLGLGPRLTQYGPLEFADRGGVDILATASEQLALLLGEPKYRPAEQVLKRVATGHLGQKTGRGFYDWR